MDWHPTSTADRQRFSPQQVFAAGLALHHLANTAYPIGHLTTMRPYRLPRSQVQAFAPLAWREVERMGLYVHVPFCQARCAYCEYTVIDPQANQASEDVYFELLYREFELWARAIDAGAKTLIGFDIGGGTPALPAVRHIDAVVQAARRHFCLPDEVAISIETTPHIAAEQPEKIQAFHAMGIRRISMGVQTVSPRLLQRIGREAASLSCNRTAVENIRAAGFERFNIDVMYGFAGQALEGLQATCQHVIDLAPEYVTLYRMRYKGTRLVAQAGQVHLEDVNRQYRLAKEMLLAAGYAGSPGKNTFSRLQGDLGASDYLTERVIRGAPYLGLGLGAQSLSHKTLAYNAGAADKRLEHYRQMVKREQLPIQDLYHLSRQAAMGKMIAVSFYFGEIDLAGFQDKFGVSLQAAFPEELDFLLREGLMEYWGDKPRTAVDGGQGAQDPGLAMNGEVCNDGARTLRLTEEGVDRVNGVIALFYAGAVKRHLLELAAGQLPAPLTSGNQLERNPYPVMQAA
ncbi:MAG: radical SAM protein [Anaerolineales bacterium]|nr:radical SAM protein [Anaerolineales bacterium]